SADPSPYRHSVVYRTARGAALSGGRALTLLVAPAAPGRIALVPDAEAGRDESGADDAAGVYDARRYSEPND
ncbi:MAG: DUF305 domain-containing protein, partial [Gammaproteobacteria bacterium]|nr:DUF305 domain-containing protein [Gammaproteobacteria bacterium]